MGILKGIKSKGKITSFILVEAAIEPRLTPRKARDREPGIINKKWFRRGITEKFENIRFIPKATKQSTNTKKIHTTIDLIKNINQFGTKIWTICPAPDSLSSQVD
jgi:hypothetical protein